ncbi:MAG: MFS transporter [Methanomassiliicoccales archaeon]
MESEKIRRRGTRIPIPLIVFGMIIAMVLVSPYEYSWTLFTKPLGKVFGVAATSYPIGTTFSVYIVVQALTMFISGRFLDKRRHLTPLFLVLAGILTSIGYILSSFTTKSLGLYYLYTMYGIGSIGVGIVYGVGVSTALKWFTGKTRGLVVGLIDLGFGAGSFAISPLIEYLISSRNFHVAFFDIGLLMLLIIPFGALVRYPPSDYVPFGKTAAAATEVRKRVKKSSLELTPGEMTKRWQFYAIYVGFFFIAGAGLGIVGKLVSIGEGLGFTIAALIAVYLFPLANGIGRFVSGVVSDFIGRQASMLLFFGVTGIGLLVIGHIGVADAYIAVMMLIAFCWGPLFTLWPAMTGDYFGEKHSGGNYGLIYTSKAVAGLFAGYAFSLFYSKYGVHDSLILTGIMSLIAAVIGFSIFVPKNHASPQASAVPATTK